MKAGRSSSIDFQSLDALLDRALTLDGDELIALLDSLDDARRDALTKLLRHSRSDVLRRIGDVAQDRLQTLGAKDDTELTAGGWRLIREIGSGGTGQVFYAERRELPGEDESKEGDSFLQRAAVKVLWSHRVTSQFRDRFLRERRILASISHPGLARFLDGGLLDDGRPWFAMEFIDGSDIVTFAREQPIAARLGLFLEVIDTIHYAHARLIVHRDIKPQNVLVDELGRPRVLDFGIARILDEFDAKELTQAQGTPVTLQYASPEQVSGRSVDVASDLYQLGLLLYEMLAGRKPYAIDESSLQRAIRTIRQEVPVPPSSYNDDVARDLDAIVAKALRKFPNQRYASAGAMAEDVRRYLDGRPVTARDHSNWYRATLFVRRNALAVAVIAASLLGLAGATAFSIKMAIDARAEANRSRTSQEILADVFQQADPFGEGGANVSLADALIRAQPTIDERIASDPRLAWEVNKTLAAIFESLGLLEMERDAYHAAWDAAKELGRDGEQERLLAVAGIGNTLARTDPRGAVEHFDAHLPSRPSDDDQATDWLSAKYAYIGALVRLREYDRADTGAADMASVAEDFGVESPITLGRIHQLLAAAARRRGDRDEADRQYQLAVDRTREAEDPSAYAIMLSNQALHYGMTGRYEKADAGFLEAGDIYRENAPNDPSYADILRLHAGLQFRTDRGEQALTTLGEAVAILDPEENAYPYFVAQLNRANFALALGEFDAAFSAIVRGLEAAHAAYGTDSDVTKRMYAPLARLLVFAGSPADAARVVAVDPMPACEGNTDALDAAIQTLAAVPAVERARSEVWRILGDARLQAERGSLDDTAFRAATDSVLREPNIFFDVLDRARMLSELNDIRAIADLATPSELAAATERSAEQAAYAQRRLAQHERLRTVLNDLTSDRAAFACP